MEPRCVTSKYEMCPGEKGKIEVVAPTSAPILHTVAIPVELRVFTPGPKYSIMKPVPPYETCELINRSKEKVVHTLTVNWPASANIMSFGEVHPLNLPSSLTPNIFGAFNSHGASTRASTASAPPTPIAIAPRPPAFGAWLSVTNIMSPGAE